MIATMKHCSRCDQDLALEDFGRNRSRADGLTPWCRSCMAEYGREQNAKPKAKAYRASYYLRNRDRISARNRVSHIQRKFGLSVEAYEALLSKQGGLCAICRMPPSQSARWPGRFCVDHDHETGRVRGLLCFNCNTGLGSFGDDPDQLRQAAGYLELVR